MVIEGEGETSDEAHVNLSKQVNGGFFLWDLRYDEADNSMSSSPSTPVPRRSLAIRCWAPGRCNSPWASPPRRTSGTRRRARLQRQADLRALLECQRDAGGRLCRAGRADAGRPTADVAGLLVQGLRRLSRARRRGAATILDRPIRNLWRLRRLRLRHREAAGEALLFGLFGGYITPISTSSQTNSKWEYEGPTVGAYATYLNQAFYRRC